MENKFERLDSAVAIVYTDDPEEEGIYNNPHFFLRRILFNEPELIHVKLKKETSSS